MSKTVKKDTTVKDGFYSLTAFALAAALMLPTAALADQQDPTLDPLFYHADDPNEVIYNLITDADTTVDGSDPLAGDGPLLLCGTNDCALDSSFSTESRDATKSGYAEVTIIEYEPAGSGYDQDGDVFLRQQHNEQEGKGYTTYETAYNTDEKNLQTLNDPNPGDDEQYQNMAKDTTAGGAPDFNHAILYSDELVNDEGQLNFLLDINEAESTSDILLDELSFFVSRDPELNLYDPNCGTADTFTSGCFIDAGADVVKVWDMDVDQLIAALMLDNTNGGSAGSGDYDAIFALDASLFLAAADLLDGEGDFYIYLENTMGRAEAIDADGNLIRNKKGASGGEVDAGFEEWKIASFTADEPGVPLPSTAFLLLLGGLTLLRKKQA